MSGDVFFKTMAFGGFNKEDVLAYIVEQQKQMVEMQKQLDDNEKQLAIALDSVESYKEKLADQQNRSDEYSALNEKYAKKIFELEDEVNQLNEKLGSIEVGCNRAKDVEGQIGALVVDALLYSDKIIQSAKASVKGISSDTKRTIEEAASGVDEIGEDITQISDDFSEIVASLVSKINSLSTNLSSVADKLEIEQTRIDRQQFTFSEDGGVHLPVLDESDFGMEEDSADVSENEMNSLVSILESQITDDDAEFDFGESDGEETVSQILRPQFILDVEAKAETETETETEFNVEVEPEVEPEVETDLSEEQEIVIETEEPVMPSDDEISEMTRRFLEGIE